MRMSLCVCVCVCVCCSIGDNGIKATIIKVLFAEMYVNVCFFVIRCLYSALSLTLVKE